MSNENSHCSGGPVSSMPGAVSHSNQPCDEHPNRMAVKRIQGETDSMGCEYFHVCQECSDKIVSPVRVSGHCDWCKSNSDSLRHRRDMDDGMAGPVYRVCGPCIEKENKAVAEELADNEEYADFYDSGF